VDVLRPGQTGCLRRGRYELRPELRFSRGGHAGAPITLRSYPGERATLTNGFVNVVHGSDYVTIENLNINATGASQNGVQILGANTILQGSNITNHNQPFSCVIIGSDVGYGQAANSLVANNVIHQCGSRAQGYQDHGIYVDNVVNATITRNVIWGSSAWAIHLYPNSQGSRVTYNVIDGNGLGVVFGGNSTYSSSNNLVANNVITNSAIGYNIEDSWVSGVGRGNVARQNCIYNGRGNNIVRVPSGFSASGNVVARPQYVDRARHDYRLRRGSQCLRVVG
jgi:Right handed beta helix region